MATLPQALYAAVVDALRTDRSKALEQEGHAAFVQVFNPSLRMILEGAVHIAQHLAPMASFAGYEVTVVDPRRSFTADHRFPSVAMNTAWQTMREALDIDRRTAVVTLTRP